MSDLVGNPEDRFPPKEAQIELKRFYLRVMPLKDAYEIAGSVDPDQTSVGVA